jgi:CBS domain-containing protein
MRAHEVMSTPVVTVTTGTPVRVAADLLSAHGFTCLPVVDEDNEIIGIVSELDVLRERLPHDPRRQLRRDNTSAASADPPESVGEVMSRVVVCLPEFTDTADIAETMIASGIRAVPITDGRRLIGIVSRRDLIRTLLRDDCTISAEIRERLTAYAGGQTRWQVEVSDGVVNVFGPFADDRQRDVVDTLATTVSGVIRVHLHPGSFG